MAGERRQSAHCARDVNHFWETIFGHGIVETSEDFGTQGDPPTHPELLDWLATEFMHNGWSMKKIQRLMVTSATYRESSQRHAGTSSRAILTTSCMRAVRASASKPKWCTTSRFPRAVCSARKCTARASSRISRKASGTCRTAAIKWVESEGEDRYRRAIYTFMRRSAPYPSLVTYDAPSREFCTVRRVRTNTPLQALTGLNDPYFFDAARAMAKRMRTKAARLPDDRITYGFRLCVSRRPLQGELDRVLEVLQAAARRLPERS